MPVAQRVPCRQGCKDKDGNIRGFNGEWGETVHYNRTHGSDVRVGKKTRKRRTHSGSRGLLDAIMAVLKDYPDGIQLKYLIEKLHASKVTNREGKSLGQAISMVAQNNKCIQRPERGFYKLSPAALAQQAAPVEQLPVKLPVKLDVEPEIETDDVITAEQQLQAMFHAQAQRQRETIMGLCQIIMSNLA